MENEAKGEVPIGKIQLVKPAVDRGHTGGNYDERRKTRKIVSKMILQSKAFIVVMWNGKASEEPVAVFDIGLLSQKDTIIAKTFGRLAQHTAASLEVCRDILEHEADDRETNERVKTFMENRSSDLAATMNGEDGEAPAGEVAEGQ